MPMKSFQTNPPLIIERAQGSILYTNQGPVIDAISSWWCKSLGHGHPAVIRAIEKQLACFEHVIGANTTHPAIVHLAERLSEITGKQHVYFASDGASAVEIAMKLAIHSTALKGFPDKNQFIALKNGYHGETLGTMSVSDLGIYKAPYTQFGVNTHFIQDIPYCLGKEDPLWTDCDSHWNLTLPQLDAISEQVCAIILEPVVQGAGGMLCYSPAFLKKLALWAKSKKILLIADEIMTGMGRTGKWLACEHAGVNPDLICLSKGLTAGTLPLSCVMIDSEIYDLFYDNTKAAQSFLHSHTYSGHALGVCAALATIQTLHNEDLLTQAITLGDLMLDYFNDINKQSGQLKNIRGLGAMVAAELVDVAGFNIAQEVARQALQAGALLRPIGNTLYWLPPFNTDEKIIGQLAKITLNSIDKAYSQAKGHEKNNSETITSFL